MKLLRLLPLFCITAISTFVEAYRPVKGVICRTNDLYAEHMRSINAAILPYERAWKEAATKKAHKFSFYDNALPGVQRFWDDGLPGLKKEVEKKYKNSVDPYKAFAQEIALYRKIIQRYLGILQPKETLFQEAQLLSDRLSDLTTIVQSLV